MQCICTSVISNFIDYENTKFSYCSFIALNLIFNTSTNNARLETIIKVFNALKAKVNFSVELYDGNFEMV